MIKKLELTHPESCLNKSADDEPLFVLCARDQLAPELIYQWIEARIITGKNKESDEQIKEAEDIAKEMVKWKRRQEELKREKMFIEAGMTWEMKNNLWTATIEQKFPKMMWVGTPSKSLYQAQENCWALYTKTKKSK